MFLRNEFDRTGLADGTTLTAANTSGLLNQDGIDAFQGSPSPTLKKSNAPALGWGEAVMHCTLGAATQGNAIWNDANSLPAGVSELWGQFYLNLLGTAPPNATCRALTLVHQGGTQAFAITFSTGRVPVLRNTSAGTTHAFTNATALAANTWYCFDWHAQIPSTGNVVFDAQIYDVTRRTAIDDSSWTTTFSSISAWKAVWTGLGNSASTTFNTGWDFAHISLSTDGPIGMRRPGFSAVPIAA